MNTTSEIRQGETEPTISIRDAVHDASEALRLAEREMFDNKVYAMNELATHLKGEGAFSDMSAFMLAMNGIIATRNVNKTDTQKYYESQEELFGQHSHGRLFGSPVTYRHDRPPETVHLIPFDQSWAETQRGVSRWGSNDYSGLRYRITSLGEGSYERFFGELVVPSLCLPFDTELSPENVRPGEFAVATIARGSSKLTAEEPVEHGVAFRADIADWAKGYYPAKYAEEVTRIATAEEILLASQNILSERE